MKHATLAIGTLRGKKPLLLLGAAWLAFALSVAFTGSMQVSAAASGTNSARATCGSAPRDKDPSSWGRFFKVNGVNIRKSPSTNSRICAQGQKSHRVDYHCYKVGSDGYTWTYLRDVTTGYAGWVRDSLLTNNGSYVHC